MWDARTEPAIALGSDEDSRGGGHFVWNLARQHVQVNRNIKEVTEPHAITSSSSSVPTPLPDVFGEVREQEEHDPPVQEPATTEAPTPVAPAPPPLEYLCPRCRNPKFTRPHSRKEGCKYAGTVYDGNPKRPGRPAVAEAQTEQVESIQLPLRHGSVSQSMIAQASTTKGVKSRVNQGGFPSAPLGTLKGVSASARDLYPVARYSSSKPILPFEDAPDDPGDFELLKSIQGENASGLRPILIKDMVRTTGVTKEAWRRAAIAEIEGLKSMQVFREATPSEVAEATKKSALLPMKLVAGEKPPEYEGGPRKKKVHLVVCGNFDRRNLATSLSTSQADAEPLRMVLRLAAWYKWDIAKADVKQAFLRAPLPEEGSVVVTTPKALEDVNVLQRSCWVLQRALYGLREAPKAWQNTRDPLEAEMQSEVRSVCSATIRDRFRSLAHSTGIMQSINSHGIHAGRVFNRVC